MGKRVIRKCPNKNHWIYKQHPDLAKCLSAAKEDDTIRKGLIKLEVKSEKRRKELSKKFDLKLWNTIKANGYLEILLLYKIFHEKEA
ncbi:MAG TPA: hypothetical protein PLZ78_08955 [Spirochaetota bacterium]|nr:hypothetical protein [Spirochaetota bacterium]